MGFSRKIEPIRSVYAHWGMLYFKELVHRIVGLARPKSVRQVHRLEVQVRIDVAVLSPKSVGPASWLETQASFLCCSPKAEFFF